jgi:hypothetical protein
MLKMIPAILVSLSIGYGLGSIPGLNEHLHWNLWYIIPSSGLLIGMLCGWVSFKICFGLNKHLNFPTIAILGISASVAYLAVDLGTYRSLTIPYEAQENIPAGNIKLSKVISFVDYMKINLGSTSVSSKSGKEAFEMGGTAAKVSYLADLIGAFLGSIFILSIYANASPYCVDCTKYKTKYKKQEIIFPNTEEITPVVFEKLAELINKADYHHINSYLEELSETYASKEGDLKTEVDQRYCSDCGSVTIAGNVFQHNTKDWNAVDELAFVFNSEPGVFELVEE